MYDAVVADGQEVGSLGYMTGTITCHWPEGRDAQPCIRLSEMTRASELQADTIDESGAMFPLLSGAEELYLVISIFVSKIIDPTGWAPCQKASIVHSW